MSKYCLQFAKCKNIDCCKPLRSNVQEILVGKFLTTPLLIQWLLGELITLQNLLPKNYKKSIKHPYYL